MKKFTQEEFLERAKKINPLDDFSKAVYVDCNTKICIICKTHGEYWIRPNDYLRGLEQLNKNL